LCAFEQALHALQEILEDDEASTQRLMHRLINEREIAPVLNGM
jgi:hypothetical protein